ncbi:Uncharacterised protein at_DN1003, partial [Pycnogonum litorale]
MSSAVLRNFRKELVLPVKDILNSCLKSKIVETQHVRPIGQTPVLLNIFLKVHLAKCVSNLDRNQFGYKENVSPADAVNLVINSAVNFLDQQHSAARILLLDYSSAFNTVCRQNILDTITENRHAPGWLLEILLSYLDVRFQYTQVGKIKSNTLCCGTGVVQGAVLSPFLFTLVTDNLRSNSKKLEIVKFADDTALVAHVTNKDDVLKYYNEVNTVSRWSKHRSLTINAKKKRK